jgi:hypothetical protein
MDKIQDAVEINSNQGNVETRNGSNMSIPKK